MLRLLAWDTETGAFKRLRVGTMKNDSLWRGTLVVAFAIGAGWIGYMGWPLNGLIARVAKQSNSPSRSQAPAVFQDPNCPGNDNHAPMCHLVNEYRAKHGLKPVQFDGLVTGKRNIGLTNRTAKTLAGFFIMTPTITPACAHDFQVVDFVKTQRAAAKPVAAPN
jgi:hypothetical protein